MRMYDLPLLLLLGLAPGCVIAPMVKVGNTPLMPGVHEVELSSAHSVWTDEKIVVIEVEGAISSQTKVGFLSERNMVADLAASLERAAQDDDVVAVVLSIDSPGGGVTASDLIHRELQRFRAKTGRPVVACMLGTAASGGLYVAMASDEIWAHPTTVTGSIGVIVQSFGIEGTLEKIGVEPRSTMSGPLKDMGSPFRQPTDEERELMQGMVDSMHGRFVQVVDEGRPKLSTETVRGLADGRIYTAQQALDNGLVDHIGYLDDAINSAMRRARVADANVVGYRIGFGTPKSLYGAESSAAGDGQIRVDLGLDRLLGQRIAGETFLYAWRPGL